MIAGSSSTLSLQHIALLCRYLGVSVIAAALGYSTLIETRTFIMVGVGISLFVLGYMIDYFTADSLQQNGLIQSLIAGLLLSLGLGLFIGGFEHFAVSPDRGVWSIPLGFLLSLIALVVSLDRDFLGHWKSYASAALVLVGTGALAAHQYFKAYPDNLAQANPVMNTNPIPAITTSNLNTSLNRADDSVNTTQPALDQLLTTPPSVPTPTEHNGYEAQTGSIPSTDTDSSLVSQTQPSLTPEQVVSQASEREVLETRTKAELAEPSATTTLLNPSAPPQATSTADNLATIPSFSPDEDQYSAYDIGHYGLATQVDREVEITILDSLRYEPNQIIAHQNETIRFVIHNNGLVKQDWVLGQSAPLRALAQQTILDPNTPYTPLLTLQPGQSAELIWQFTQSGNVDFASLQPGQYGAGMVGRVVVMPKE